MKMMSSLLLAILIVTPVPSQAQVSGNLSYSQSGAKARAFLREQNKRVVVKGDKLPSSTSSFLEADVLINVKADEFVAVFGIAQEGKTPDECSQRMDAAIKQFTEELKTLKVEAQDVFVDYVTQTKIYGFELMGDVAREKLVGFELKKNVSVHYKDRLLLDQLVVAAAHSKIHDLIKVDYVVNDVQAIQGRLMDEAAKIIQAKRKRHETLLEIKLQPPAQILAEKYATHYPTGMYDSYTAAESEDIELQSQRQKHTVHLARKGRTFVFNGLDSDGFDQVVNPVVTEPVVQFTLYLKLKYEVEQKPAM